MSFTALAWVMDTAPCPSSQTFAALIVFASFANEHGRAYPSTETVAAKSRQNQKTVRAAIATLQIHGLLVDTGRRVGRTGNVRVYALGMEGLPEVGSLPGEIAPDADAGSQEAAGGAVAEVIPETGGLNGGAKAPVSGLKPSQKRVAEPVREPLPLEEANASSAPAGAETIPAAPIHSAAKGRSEGWTVPPIDSLPDVVRAIAKQWPRGAYDTVGTGHAAWLAGKRRVRDRDASWHSRIVQLGDQPIRAAKGGLRYETTTAGAVALQLTSSVVRCDIGDEGDGAVALRQAMRQSCGDQLYGQWFEPCRYDMTGDRLTVIAPRPVVRDWLRNNYGDQLARTASKILGTPASVEWGLDAAA